MESTPPPTPKISPEEDLAAREKEIVRDLGEGAKTALVEERFLLAGKMSRGAFAGTKSLVKRVLHAYYNGRFDKRPERVIAVYLFPNLPPYNAYCVKRWGRPCGTPYGFYLSDDRLIVMNIGPGVGTLTHELVHPIIEADFPQAPDWINEGIASLFERFYLIKKGEIVGGKNWRHPRLLGALYSKKERDLARPQALFGMSDATFRGRHEDLNYASARYFCQWLDAKKLLWPFYQRWRDNYSTDPTGEKSFQAVVGKSPEEVDKTWAAWVKRL